MPNKIDVWSRNSILHEKLVKETANRFNGIVFKRAPFDLILQDGRFVEIKTSSATSYHKWRLHITEDELKFGQLKELWLLFANDEGQYLFPFEEIRQQLQLRKKQVQLSPNNVKRVMREIYIKKILKKYYT